MRKRLFRFRRVAVAALTGTTVITGMTLIGVGAGTASASTSATLLVGADAPVPVTTSSSPLTENVGNFYASFTNNWGSTDTITFQVEDHSFSCNEVEFSTAGSITVTNSHVGDTTPTFNPGSVGSSGGPMSCTNDTLTYGFSNTPTGTASDVWDVTISGLHYTIEPSAADGNVAVSAEDAEHSIVSGAGSSSLSSPSGTSAVSNADVVGVELGADEPLNLTAPGANQPASDFLGSITNSFIAGAGGNLRVVDKAFGNCTGTETVGFVGTPTVTVTADPHNKGTGETAPTVTAVYSSSAGACTTAGVKDVVTFTVTNNATGLTTSDLWNIDVSGVEYTVGATAAPGDVGFIINNAFASHEPGDGNVHPIFWGMDISNAIISNVVEGANSPPVGIDLPHSANNKAQNQPISPITLTEQSAGILPSGSAPDDWVCITFPSSNTVVDTSTSVPSVSVDAASGAVVGPLSVINGGSAMVFEVTTPSTAAGTFTISGINVDTSTNNFTYALARGDENSACSNDGTAYGDVPAFYAATTHPIFGATADDTAQAEFQYFNGGNGCANNNANADYPAVLARDDLPYDALAGAYLAGQLDTSTLLTPGGLNGTLSDSTLNALRIDGVQTVYVLGGPGAISYPIVAQLESTQAYACGGVQTLQQANSLANPVYLNVIRIWGNTADDTAGDIGQYFGSGPIGIGKFPGAYGMYNDTGAAESLPPINTGLRTAIVATDSGFQDATSAGPASWDESYPVLLTPSGGLGSAAGAALSNLNIEQVIVMGGQAAVSDTVVSQIQSLGIPVLRIAGHDFTDTSQLMAQFEQTPVSSAVGREGLDWNDADVFLARGDYFGDSLAGAALAGSYARPILLSENPTTQGPGMVSYFSRAGLDDGAYPGGYSPFVLRILGGPAAFTQVLINQILNEISAGDNAG